MDAKEKIMTTIRQIESDIAMHTRLLGECETEAGRAYQIGQIESLKKRLAKRQDMLAAEIASTN